MFSLGIVTEAFYGIVLTLDTWVYGLISSAYKIFMAIASARILSSDAYTSIANKVYIIVGVGMLFVLAYAILKAIIDPDQLSKGDMAGTKILKSIAITVIGLIVTPLIFDLAYMAQGKMLEEDILGKLFFRTGDSTVDVSGVGTVNYDEELEHTGGGVAATSVWMAFFYPAEGVDPEDIIADPDIIRLHATATAVGCAAAAAIAIAAAALSIVTWGTSLLVGGAAVGVCAYSASTQFEAADDAEAALGENEDISLVDAYNLTASGASFGIYQGFIEPLNDDEIKYTWFVSTVCGGFVAYAFVSYAIDMGLRAAKLAYYQIIAPIPLILNVMPKNGDRIGKFVKAVFSTFLEVFVRISVVYIVIYIIAHLQDLFSTLGALWDNEHLTDVESLITMALLIIGLVLFAKQAPKIISDTFGLSTGGALEGLNIMKKLRDGEVFTAGSVLGSAGLSAAQGFRSNFGKKTKKVYNPETGKYDREVNRKMHERIIGGIGTGLFGGASGGVRSTVGRFKSGKPVASGKDMRDTIDSTSDKVSQRRENVHQDLEKNGTGEDGRFSIKTYATNKAKNAWSTLDRITSPSITDVPELETIKTYGAVADKKDAYRSKTGKVTITHEAEDWVESVKNNDKPVQYYEDAYKAALQAAASNVERIAGESEADYQRRVNEATSRVNREDFRNANYAAELMDYQRKVNGATKMSEAVKDVSYMELLFRGDAKTTAEFKKDFMDMLPQLRAEAQKVVGPNGETVEQLYRQKGMDINTGEINWDTMRASTPMKYTIVTDTGNVEYNVTFENGQNVIRDAAGNVVDRTDFFARASQADVQKVDATTAVTTISDTMKDARYRIENDKGFNDRLAKYKAAKEKKGS